MGNLLSSVNKPEKRVVDELCRLMRSRTLLPVEVTGFNKGGVEICLTVDELKVRGFVPSSAVVRGLKRKALKGERIEVLIVSVGERFGQLQCVASQKRAVQRMTARMLSPEDTITGKIRKKLSNGIILDLCGPLRGATAFVPAGEVVRKPLRGEVVTACVLSVNVEKDLIVASIRKTLRGGSLRQPRLAPGSPACDKCRHLKRQH